MAITAFAPAITRSKEILVEKSNQVVLKLVPDLSSGEQADRKFFAKFVTIVGVIGLMFLLLINTLLAQDAIAMKELKDQVKLVSDQREAIERQIDTLSAPEALANAATALGMKPSESPTFLILDKPADKTPVSNG